MWTFCFIVLLLITPNGVKASGYRVTSFDSKIVIEQSTSLRISETIKTDFLEAKHGIYRYIPIVYRSGNETIKVYIGNISIKDENGNGYGYSTSRNNDILTLKIGDKNRTITGKKTYIINYTIDNVLRRFEGYDELYWNVVGSGWDVPIEGVTAEISTEYAKAFDGKCFSECTPILRDNYAQYTARKAVSPGEDFTFALKLDPNSKLIFPDGQELWWKYNGMWLFLVPVPLVISFILWWKKGRDFKYSDNNIYYQGENAKTQVKGIFEREHLPLVYSPIKNLTPAEAGTIIDMKVDLADLVAEISELARLRYINIKKLTVDRLLISDSVDYEFERTDKEADSNLKKHQLHLLSKLFDGKKKVKVSALKGKFAEHLNKFRDILYENLTKEGFFDSRPDYIKGLSMAAGGISSFVLTIIAATTTMDGIVTVTGIVSGIGCLILGSLMSRRTAKGYAMYRQLTGLKYFVGKGKWRYEIAEKRLFLEEILPLAISLGIVGKLTAEMKELQIPAPQYMGNMVVADFGGFGKSVSSAFAYTSSNSWSGGSGFSGGSSGGGFGGGGGGSW